MEEENPIIRCSSNFKELIDDIKKKWQEKYGFEISSPKATSLITKKISAVGGIRI